jgi:hypothetical protein
MKKTLPLIIGIVTIASLASFGMAQAQGTTASESQININVPGTPATDLPGITSENPASLNNLSLAQVISRGTRLINTRLTSLNNLKNLINKSKLTTDQKNSLNSMIDDNIAGLNQQKTKIAADTDLTTAKADVSYIYTYYRIYAVFIPKIHALKMLSLDQNTLNNFQNTVFVKYQAKIDSLKTNNGNATTIANMEAGLAKAKNDATTAGSLITSTTAQAQNLQPSDYPTQSKTIITGIRANIKTVRTDFQTIRTDLRIKGRITEKVQ